MNEQDHAEVLNSCHSVRAVHPVHRMRLESCGKIACVNLVKVCTIIHEHKGAGLRL